MRAPNLYAKFRLQMNPGAVFSLGKKFKTEYTRGVGAYVMTAARSSLRPGKQPAEPGKPPRTHARKGGKSPLKHGIFFAAEKDAVVVGPVALEGKTYQGVTGARLLEQGGSRIERYPNGRSRRLKYRKFPYMVPALKKGLDDYRRKTGDIGPRAKTSS